MYEEAEPLFRRSLAMQERALGPDHPSVAMTLDDLARFLTNAVSVLYGFRYDRSKVFEQDAR